ncbi:MAG: substrate-binding domain-containing protein [Saprospiraceae bacterium]|nr:substrate-binding domain-containing protein [Saprospiraceae bacterium]
MKLHFPFYRLFILGLILVASDSCGDGENSGDQLESKGLIGIAIMSSENPFFNVLANAADQEARKHGYETEILSGDNDPDKQDRQIKDFIAKKVAAIIISPCNAHAIGASIKSANQAGIPVFMADTGTTDSTAQVVSTIETANYEGGIQAGHAMTELLGEEGGEVLVLDFKQAESCLKRVAGFKKVIAEHNVNNPDAQIEIVNELASGGRRDVANQSTSDALQAHPNLKAIFAINDPAALGAYAAIEKVGKQDDIKIIGFDGMPEGKTAIKEGKIYADPIQFPDRIGQMTVQTIMRYFDGEQVEPRIEIPTYLYKKADAEADPAL